MDNKNPSLDKNFLINTINNAAILQPQNNLQMPQLSLRCAQFFHSLSQYCLHFYKNYNKQADVQKTKLIKKAEKSRKDKHDKKSKHSEAKRKDSLMRNQQQPEPPKKPLTAYIIYFQDKKPSFAQKFPSLSLSELTKLIAKDWKQLNDSQKKPYLDKASDDRKRYQEQMIQFRSKYNKKQSTQQNFKQTLKINKSQGDLIKPSINGMEVQEQKEEIQQEKRDSNQNEENNDNENQGQNEGMEEQQADNDNQNQNGNNDQSQNGDEQQNQNQNNSEQDQNDQEQQNDVDADADVDADVDNDVDNDNEEGVESSEK